MSVADLPPLPAPVELAGVTAAVLAACWLGWRAHAARHIRLEARRRAETALRDSEERFRALAEAAPDAVVVAGAGGRIEHVNPQAAALFGHAAEDMLGRPLALLMPPGLAGRHDACLARARDGPPRPATGRPREVQGRHRDGSLLHLQLSVGEIRLSNGLHFVAFLRDLGERRHEQALRDQLQRRLAHSQRLGALGQSTAGIAHDFKNMLTGILGLSQLALERRLAEPGSPLETYLRQIVKVGTRGRDLVERLLAHSRPDAAPPAEPLDVGAGVRDIAGMLGRVLPAGIELALACDAGLPGVRLAEAELHRVLMNLVANAHDAIGERGRIVVGAAVHDGAGPACASCGAVPDGRGIVLSVADDGPGIAPEALARVFEPFFTTKAAGRGTGLGLSTVRDVAHAAGGHVTVTSTPGHGTTVRVWLPAAADEAPPPA